MCVTYFMKLLSFYKSCNVTNRNQSDLISVPHELKHFREDFLFNLLQQLQV